MEISLKASFVFYAVAMAATLIGFLFSMPGKFRYSIFALFAGFLSSTYHIGARWYIAGRAPLSNQYESMVFLVWAFVGAYLLFWHFSAVEKAGKGHKHAAVPGRAIEWLAPWTALVAVLSLGGASFLESDISPLVPALQSNWLLIHVSTVMTGYGALLLSFLGAAVYSFMGKLKHDEKKISLESLVYRACLVGFWLLTLGIITGAVWANSAWGSYWSWDPKETWSLITWLYYAVAIHLRRTKGWKDKKFAGLMLWGFVLVMFTYFGVNYLMSGLHSYGRS